MAKKTPKRAGPMKAVAKKTTKGAASRVIPKKAAKGNAPKKALTEKTVKKTAPKVVVKKTLEETVTQYNQLRNAIISGHSKKATALLAAGASPTGMELKGVQQAPLHICVLKNRDVLMRHLLSEYGTQLDLNVQDDWGETPFCTAAKCYNGREDKKGTALFECAQMLAEAGADSNVVNDDGQTALCYATDKIKGVIEMIQLLTRAGADPNKHKKGVEPPLHRACGLGHASIVEILLGAGANPAAKYKETYAFDVKAALAGISNSDACDLVRKAMGRTTEKKQRV